MPRTTLTFVLSHPDIRRHLIHEFGLHPGVVVAEVGDEESPMISIETADAPPALWDVRATVVMFDDHAQEVEGQ